MQAHSHHHKRLQSIQARLTALVLMSVTVALVIAAVLSMWREAERFLITKQELMTATAGVFSAAVSAATAREDAHGVSQALRGITKIPGLLLVSVTTPDGSQLASIGNAVRLVSDLDIGEISGSDALWRLAMADTITISMPITDGGRDVGSLTLVAHSDLREKIGWVLVFALAGSAIALLPSLLLSRRLQRSIISPIQTLAKAMDDIASTGNYRPVAVEASDKETFRLTASFNAMITAIAAATDKILLRESEIIQRLSRAGELRDDQTGQHVHRVAQITRILAENLGLDRKFVDDLCRASPMHDVGKISIPDAILHKPGRLDAAEREEMEKHALRGYEILAGSDSELVKLAAEIALTHHERWDGTGYPNRIVGTNIPISGRLTAVADVCDALFSERPYKTPWPAEQVRQHFIDSAGTHFDPDCVQALMVSWQEVRSIYSQSRIQ